MITRYTRPEMTKIWSEENKFKKWLAIELAAVEYYHDKSIIPTPDYHSIITKASFNVTRIKEIEAEINHDVIAFLTNLAENIGESSRYVHLGLTSSDIVDTAFSLQIQDAGQILLTDLEKLKTVVKDQAFEHKLTPMMGRTHGVHAEPTTFGHKLAIWYDELARNHKRLKTSLVNLKVGKISGAVGNYAHILPEMEVFICQNLELTPAKASSQILQRDRHAEFMTVLAIIAGTLEKIATEIRALQKTEFNELQEPFSKKQKGSSAMPHKRNPILCERVSGLARVIRGYALTSLENQALWHERDISHSSTERIIFPDATELLDYMFYLLINIIKDLVVNKTQMLENIEKSHDIFYSQQLLLKLIEKGISREKAYRLVQANAIEAFESRISFAQIIKKDPEITSVLTQKELLSVFDFNKYLINIEETFTRVFQ
ncbi:MAG: adenylosuccinate lyase [Candidatus Margulisiibacteriota bacterium]|jgi:adenylosuccinate lyase